MCAQPGHRRHHLPAVRLLLADAEVGKGCFTGSTLEPVLYSDVSATTVLLHLRQHLAGAAFGRYDVGVTVKDSPAEAGIGKDCRLDELGDWTDAVPTEELRARRVRARLQRMHARLVEQATNGRLTFQGDRIVRVAG